jgi:hypothetical protein
MQIEEIVSMIRKSDIGNIMYKMKPNNNYLGVYGLKVRPTDIQFLETGPITDVDHAATIKKSQTLFRTYIPKDFVMLSSPKFWVKAQDNKAYAVNEYHLVDLDLYTYLLAAEAARMDLISPGSNNYSHLFFSDGRQTDYTKIILENIYKYSFILGDESKLIPYIYKKNNQTFFAEISADDVLIGPFGLDENQLELAFQELNIFFDIKNKI